MTHSKRDSLFTFSHINHFSLSCNVQISPKNTSEEAIKYVYWVFFPHICIKSSHKCTSFGTLYLLSSIFWYYYFLFWLNLMLLWPPHTISHCITMNLQSQRGSYTLVTFITIIVILIFPLFDSVLGGVYTFFSSCHYLSFLVWTRLNWKGLLGIGVWGCFLLHLFPSSCPQTHLVFD